MDRDFLLNHLVIGLKTADEMDIPREELPEFLTNGVWNDWLVVERAKIEETISWLGLRPK